MNRIHVVREAFSLDGKDYRRGDEISDRAEVKKVRETHAHHLNAQHHECGAEKPATKTPEAPKSAS
jgi:hypothetical protein